MAPVLFSPLLLIITGRCRPYSDCCFEFLGSARVGVIFFQACLLRVSTIYFGMPTGVGWDISATVVVELYWSAFGSIYM